MRTSVEKATVRALVDRIIELDPECDDGTDVLVSILDRVGMGA